MKRIILLSFTLLMTLGLWAQEPLVSEEVTVKPPKFTGEKVQLQSNEMSIQNYIIENMQYPAEDLTYKREGTEVIRFTVETDGRLSNYEVVNSVSRAMDDELIRVLSSTSGYWLPGQNNDVDVAMEREVAIACKVLNEGLETTQTNFKVVATNYFRQGSKLLYTKHHPQRAIAKFDRGIRYMPYDANLLVLRGYARFAAGDRDGAIADWKIVKEKTNIDNLKSLASTYSDLDGYAELIKEVDE
ncbi:energy transducer TonB [Mangrovibacterium diazotrophicum]|uniref:TonB family protein n=1 Tax=Mangrovibacterium diazotrophicum TaxID=1261403 RepID=A0A419W6E4_9BACT|nr:energy transducer TonB [Mangrovibacterium diazotrophicum]RKD91043.1 TonB family protein [Mangrovibacterium diazotrophicum]